MEYIRIKDIDFNKAFHDGITNVFGIFMATDVDVRLQKDGVTKFISLNMRDQEVKIDAKKFGATDEEISQMVNGGVYKANIQVKNYKNSYSCVLYNFEPCLDVPPSTFVEWADGMQDASEIINSALQTIGESIYSELVFNILRPVWQKFTCWSAANSLHHNMMGGLLVHTAEVIAQSEQIADFWEEKYGPNFINKSLLLSGALLHDVAKIDELDVDQLYGTTSYSVRATLETHITMCVSMIDVEAYKLSFGYPAFATNENGDQVQTKSQEQIDKEKEALSLLKHLILSHHGKKEWGSPITPSVPEAYILHIADNISAEMFRFNKTLNSMEQKTSNTVWLNGDMVSVYKDSSK